jgi:hypothetical protein
MTRWMNSRHDICLLLLLAGLHKTTHLVSQGNSWGPATNFRNEIAKISVTSWATV